MFALPRAPPSERGTFCQHRPSHTQSPSPQLGDHRQGRGSSPELGEPRADTAGPRRVSAVGSLPGALPGACRDSVSHLEWLTCPAGSGSRGESTDRGTALVSPHLILSCWHGNVPHGSPQPQDRAGVLSLNLLAGWGSCPPVPGLNVLLCPPIPGWGRGQQWGLGGLQGNCSTCSH